MLLKYKEHISSIGSIATAIGVLAALYFSINNMIIKPKKPALDILQTQIEENKDRLIIYNGGNGPCVELSIEYPNKFIKVEQIVNYETSWHTNKKMKNEKFIFPARIYDDFNPKYFCKNEKCVIDAGFLAPNQVFPLEFTGKNNKDIKINFKCIGVEKNIVLN